MFVDEMGVNLAMTPTMARAPVGERAYGVVPAIRAANVSVAAAVRKGRPPRWYPHDGAIDEERFLRFFVEQVVPELGPGDVVVLDNVKFHKANSVRAAVEAVGARLLFIPAYHPELNAIEEVFSVVKGRVRRLEPRTTVELVESLRASFAAVTSDMLSAFVTHMLGFAIQET